MLSAAQRARIAGGVAALLAGAPAPPEETFFVVRRLLAALASERPLVLAVDDLHWAEPLLLDLVEHLVQWGEGVPLLVLAAARPELRDVRSSLASPGGPASDVVTLAGLDAGAATRLHTLSHDRFQQMHADGLISDDDWQSYLTTPPPEYVSPIVAWLCTDQAAGVTGEVFHAAGGLVGRWTAYTDARVAYRGDHRSNPPWTLDELDRIVPAHLLPD